MVFQFASLVDDLAIDLEYDALDCLSTEFTLRELKASEASILLRSVNRKLTSCYSNGIWLLEAVELESH